MTNLELAERTSKEVLCKKAGVNPVLVEAISLDKVVTNQELKNDERFLFIEKLEQGLQSDFTVTLYSYKVVKPDYKKCSYDYVRTIIESIPDAITQDRIYLQYARNIMHDVILGISEEEGCDKWLLFASGERMMIWNSNWD
jgi:hypothetical protein